MAKALTKKSERRQHICKWCKKGFTTERTLVSHMCAKKKRFSDKDTAGSKKGFKVFQRFYDLTTISKRVKTVEDFIESSYYTEFVKFGRHLIQLDPIRGSVFIDYVINKGIKLKDWTSKAVYDAYLKEMINKESAEDALERSILTMCKWAEEEDTSFDKFFIEVEVVEAMHLIFNGRISPWVLFLSETAEQLFERFSDEQFELIAPHIDAGEWKKRIDRHKEDAKFVQTTLKDAGL